MAEYFIGMHGKFDDEKFKRDFTEGITGIEFCNFSDKAEIERMLEKAEEHKFKIGIHFPLDKASYRFRDPLILALNEEERNRAFKALETEMKFAAQIGAEYLLIHFPKPMALDKRWNWEMCYFATQEEMMYDTEYQYDIFEENCREAFKIMSRLSLRTGIPIVLELDFLNSYLYEGRLLKELLQEYPVIKLCIDSARLYIQSVIDKEFKLDNFLEEMTPYAKLLHMSNTRVTDKLENRHYPVIKELKAEDGWGDMGRFLELVSKKNKNLKILFEHRSDLISYEELMKCYQWVRSYFD